MPPAPPAEARGYEFVLGFAFLKSQMGSLMGDPVESEHGNPDNCDTQQLTTTGLAYWRCSSNLMSFAAYPDGAVHWAWAGPGLIEWTGPDADPPPQAPQVVATASGGDAPLPGTACMAAASVPSLTCTAGNSLYATGALQDSGDTVAFGLNMPRSGLKVTADLGELAADYDLYLADSGGNIIGQSMQEGTTPEHIDAAVDGGTYYLYVHSDPGRPVDAYDAFRLQVSVSGSIAASTQESP